MRRFYFYWFLRRVLFFLAFFLYGSFSVLLPLIVLVMMKIYLSFGSVEHKVKRGAEWLELLLDFKRKDPLKRMIEMRYIFSVTNT